MSRLFALSFALALVGCASSGEYGEYEESTAERHDAYCKSIGAYPGTQSYTDCRLRVMHTETQAQAIVQAGAFREP
jgi:hypothetical protein